MVGDKILIKRIIKKETDGGIVMVSDDALEPKPKAEVLMVGKKVKYVKAGDIIRYEPMTEIPIVDEYFIIKESNGIVKL